ncbi:MAG: hypothetical protein ACRC3J_01875 [Culicoidibacterales bacterium]
MKLGISLKTLREFGACYTGYNKLFEYLYDESVPNDRYAYARPKFDDIDDQLNSLDTIVKSNGIIDTVWCFRYVRHEIRFADFHKSMQSLVPTILTYIDSHANEKLKPLIGSMRDMIDGKTLVNDVKREIYDYRAKNSTIDDRTIYNDRLFIALDSLFGIYNYATDVDTVCDEIYNAIHELHWGEYSMEPLVIELINQMEQFK